MSDRLVDFSYGQIIKIKSTILNEMKKIAKSNSKKKRYRICLHDSPDNLQQEMIICNVKGDYSRTHKHIGISETHTIIEGSQLVVLFDDYGKVVDHFIMNRHEGYLSCRINAEVYHMSIPLTEFVVVYEVKPGPFKPESNIFPEWAPDGEDENETKKFINSVLLEISFETIE